MPIHYLKIVCIVMNTTSIFSEWEHKQVIFYFGRLIKEMSIKRDICYLEFSLPGHLYTNILLKKSLKLPLILIVLTMLLLFTRNIFLMHYKPTIKYKKMIFLSSHAKCI